MSDEEDQVDWESEWDLGSQCYKGQLWDFSASEGISFEEEEATKKRGREIEFHSMWSSKTRSLIIICTLENFVIS